MNFLKRKNPITTGSNLVENEGRSSSTTNRIIVYRNEVNTKRKRSLSARLANAEAADLIEQTENIEGVPLLAAKVNDERHECTQTNGR